MRTVSPFLLILSVLAVPVAAEPAPEHEAQRRQATEAYEAGNWQQVISLSDAIIRLNDKDNAALHLRGGARIEFGIAMQNVAMIRQGIADTRQAITVATKPDFNYYLPYLYGMTHLTRIEGQNSHAEVAVNIAAQLLGQAAINNEQKANVLYQRALANGAMKKVDEAIKDFRAAIAAEPTHMASFMAMADTYAEAKKLNEAAGVYKEAIQKFPNDPLVYNNEGMFYQKNRRYNDAIKSFSAALQKDPKYFIALTNRGFTWLEGGRPAEAEKDFNASLQLNSNQPAVQGMRGTAKLLSGRWQEAVRDYEAVTTANREDPIAHADVGFARYFGGDFKGALLSFNEVIRISPQARFINPWRTWTLVRLGRTAEATGIAQSSRQKAEKERDWIDWLVLYHVGDIPSDQLMNRIDRTDTDIQTAQLCEARFFIAEHLAKSGQGQQASASYKKAIETNKRQLSAWRGASYAIRRFQ